MILEKNYTYTHLQTSLILFYSLIENKGGIKNVFT